MENLIKNLNEPQRTAAVHADGPLLILAGPGSGKTRVITHRAAYLARTVAEPYEILAITFTNKAAREMRERIEALGVHPGMTVCTFHAFCARLLRTYSEIAELPKTFTIFDQDDRRRLLKQAIKECNLPESNWLPTSVEPIISKAKNELMTYTDFERNATDWAMRTHARIYEAYEHLRVKMNGLDFDDLLMQVALGLKNNADLCERLENRFRYVLIDEYQDTNKAQYLIARLLTQQRANICATGDPDQSIYGWRGADIQNILSFEHDYPSAMVVFLEQNYRSTPRILAAADAVIAGNTQRKEKTLWTQNEDGPPVRVWEYESSEEEASGMVCDINDLLQNGVKPNEIAIFYRVNSLSRGIEEAFVREGVLYQIARGVAFYNRKEIKDLLAYLRVTVNPSDEVALLRIINTPTRGIGQSTVAKIAERAKSSGKSIIEIIQNELEVIDIGRVVGKVHGFAEILKTLQSALTLSAPKALEFIAARSGLRAHYRTDEDEENSPARNIDELISAATEFQEQNPEATVHDWLEHASLLGDVDTIDEHMGAVTLMTLHAAKGLEFPHVYIVGLEEGLLPLRHASRGDGDIEEERRLLFVGMTRAKFRLTLSHARYRRRRAVTERTVKSSFLDELPRDAVEWSYPRASHGKRQATGYRGKLPSDVDQWMVGSLVRHPNYGLGRVTRLEPFGQLTRVNVMFQNGTARKWVLEHADLTRVDFDEVG